MKRKDCAYCIDLDEQGALCDHPLHWYCGEPVEVGCSSRCADYERRISVTEALSRIHDLEAKLAESEKYRAGYADMLIPLKSENNKLRELVRDLWHLLYDWLFKAHELPYDQLKAVSDRMRKLGMEVD